MQGVTIETKALPEPLHRLLQTSTVEVYQESYGVLLVPHQDDTDYRCEFLGALKSEDDMVEKFLVEKREERRRES
jgi:hypothetical protein